MTRKATNDEARQLLSVPFALTRTVRVPENLRRARVGESDGRRVWTFDLAINPQSHDQGTDYTHDNYSAAVVQLPARLDGRVALARKGFLRRAERAGMPEVEAGTEQLRRKFGVRSASGPLAERILDDRVCAWLTGPGRGFHYEIVHDRVLAYGWRRWLGGKGPLRAALGLATQLTGAAGASPAGHPDPALRHDHRVTDARPEGERRMLSSNPIPDVALWPTGIARFDDGVLEVTSGDGIRVAARDIVEIGVDPPRAGRLSLTLRYRAGLNSASTSYWVQPEHETALRRLIDAVATTRGDA